MYDYRMMNGYGYDPGFGWVMMAFWGVVFVIVILVVLRLTRGYERHGMHPHRHDAIDIAKERYAKGEIDKEQFEQLKKDLDK